MERFLQKALRLLGDNSRKGTSELVYQPSKVELANRELIHPVTSQPDDTISLTNNSSQSNLSNYPLSVQYQWVYNLTIANLIEFEELTFPSLQKRWQTHQQRGELGGVAAFVDGVMVGLVIAELLPQQAEIISLLVIPQYRKQGIGSKLIQNLEKALIKMDCPQVQLNYRANESTTAALEPLLQHQGWQPPKTEFLITKTTIEVLKQAPWVYQYPLPSQFTVFPWVDLTEVERAQIQQRKAYSDALSPFDSDPRLETLNSLGLRYQERVIGWTITHRVAADTIRYSSMFVEPSFQRMGRGFSLLAEAVQRQIDSGILYASTAVSSANTQMLRCAERHYKPYATYLSESRSSYKPLDVSNDVNRQ